MVVACGWLVGFANDTKLELAKTVEDGIKIQKISIDWKNELKLTRLNITRDNCKVDFHSEFASQLHKNKMEKTWSCVKMVWVTWSTVWSSSQETSFGLRPQ